MDNNKVVLISGKSTSARDARLQYHVRENWIVNADQTGFKISDGRVDIISESCPASPYTNLQRGVMRAANES